MVGAKKEVINSNLPNKEQRKGLCDLIYCAFTDIRAYARSGKSMEAAELADIFHNIPQEMYGYGLWDLPSFLESLQDYQEKYGGTNYVAYLDKIFNGEHLSAR
jgi:hypothetical protein